MQIVHRFH